MAKENNSLSGWTGWIAFASIMLITMGIFHAIAGLVALFNNEVFVVGAENVWLLDYTSWGWAHIIWGLLGVWAGMSLVKGGMFGRIIAIFVAVTSAILNLAFVPIYPIWSIIIITIDVLVIYAVTVHGSEMKELQ